MKRLLLLAVVIHNSISELTEIPCPLPGGPSSSSEDKCKEFTGCAWNQDECYLKSEMSYQALDDLVDTERGFKVTLQKIDPTVTLFDDDIQRITLEIIGHTNYHVQIKIYDSSNARYEVPVPVHIVQDLLPDPLYDVEISKPHEPFQLKVVRRDTQTSIFQTVGPLIFEDQFLQFTTSLPSPYLYGFGENMHTSLKHQFSPSATYPMFPRDQPVSPEEINNYGYHPYYVVMEDDEGNAHSVLLRTSNAMEYMTFLLSGNPSLTLRTIGGIIDLHFFMGPHPEDVNWQYTEMIGHPTVPPYWALGFHLSRYGYTGVEEVRQIREKMKAEGIPQDVQTFDIDYMMRFRDFTYDDETWKGLPEFLEELHNDNIKSTLILDPALVVDFDNYPPSKRGKEKDVFIKWISDQYVPEDQPADALDYMVGYVWPDTKTVFPDFLNPATQEWWANELEIFHQTLPFDSIWVDMNEPANFGTNLDKPWNYPDSLPPWSLKCPYNRWDSPPFQTKASYIAQSESKRLSDKTLCMSALQTDGNSTFLHYDVHSLYGWSESVATYKGLERIFPGKRQVVLSRSTYPGSGTYAVHWLGDNTSNWEQLKLSIIGLIEFNLFAIPMVGADVCGFFGDSDEELCARWMQLGAFYPFDRNHNSINQIAQDPTTSSVVAEASKAALNIRYGYLPYLYSLFYDAYSNGQSVIRPLWNYFPSDLKARDIDDQFMWGTGIMVAPVVEQGSLNRDVYFPEGYWYDIESGKLVSDTAQTLNIEAPLHKIPVYLRGGTILPYQIPAMNTEQSRHNPFAFIIVLNEQQNANGFMFWDDGESVIQDYETELYYAEFEFQQNVLDMEISHGNNSAMGYTIGEVLIYGLTSTPSHVYVNEEITEEWTYSNNMMSILVDAPLNQELELFFNTTSVQHKYF